MTRSELRKTHFCRFCQEDHVIGGEVCEGAKKNREEVLAQTIKDTEEKEDPQKVEADMWTVAKRLQYVVHVRKRTV